MTKKEDEEEEQEEDEEVTTTKKKKSKEKWSVQQVSTQTAPAIVNVEEGEALSMEVALCQVLNNQEKLMKLLD